MQAIHSMKKSFIIILTTAFSASADHGPGTSGSGFATQTAETLATGKWAASLSHDWTEFGGLNANLSDGVEHLDLIGRANLTTMGISLGVAKDLHVGLNFGYYSARGTKRLIHDHDEAEHHEEEAGHGAKKREFATFDSEGWTDAWVNAKWRAYRGPAGQFALLAGVKLPVGETDILDSGRERVEAASTPGSGAWDGMAGVAYTLQLSEALALDASAQYTFRGEKSGYRIGNRFDAGAALGWRVLGHAANYPQVHVLAEVSYRHIDASKKDGHREPGTGGQALFLSPGARVSFSPEISWTVGAQLPVMQNLNEVQVETCSRISTSLNITF